MTETFMLMTRELLVHIYGKWQISVLMVSCFALLPRASCHPLRYAPTILGGSACKDRRRTVQSMMRQQVLTCHAAPVQWASR